MPREWSAPLPEHFPVFPLTGALLLPHGCLPLNVFEPRYLAMTDDALATGRHIGMIQPNPAERPGATGPALHRIGCIGRLISFSETDDGRYLITLAGVVRFAVIEELTTLHGYRRVRGDVSAFTEDLMPLEPSRGLDRTPLFEVLKRYFARQGVDANWSALEHMSDSVLVATLAMACPFGPQEKQALLEAPDFEQRAATLLTLLRIESHANDGHPSSRFS